MQKNGKVKDALASVKKIIILRPTTLKMLFRKTHILPLASLHFTTIENEEF